MKEPTQKDGIEKEFNTWRDNFCHHISDWSYYTAYDELGKMKNLCLAYGKLCEERGRKQIEERGQAKLDARNQELITAVEGMQSSMETHPPTESADFYARGFRQACSIVLTLLNNRK